MTTAIRTAPAYPDQAQRPAFRLTQLAQALAALVFGVAPILAAGAYASFLGFSGHDQLVYRLGGAATFGYVVPPLVAIMWRSGWRDIRIPAVATLTFTVGALLASAWELVAGAREPVVPFVAVAATGFTAVALYWIRRDEGTETPVGRPLTTPARGIVALATLSAATFGLLPLLSPSIFSTAFNLAGTDAWVFRLAGAGCLGYATAGIASLAAPGYGRVRLQNLSAITFNFLGAVSAWYAVANGDGGLLAPIVAAAATFFTVALAWIDRTLA